MSDSLAKKTGSALSWKTFQLGATKLIYLARTLILTRLLVPDDFGLLAIAVIAVDTLASLTDIGMIPALIQKQNTDERHAHTAWTVGLVRAVVIAVVIFFAAPLLANLFTEPRATLLIQAMSLRPILEATASIRLAELMRSLRFRSVAFITLPDVLVNMVVSIALASRLGVWALVVGTLAGQVVYLVMSYILAPYQPRLVCDREVAMSLIHFGRWILLMGVIALIGNALLQMMISRRLGTADLGLYFLASKLAFIPGEIAQEVVGAVTFPLYANLQTNLAQASRAFRALLSGLAALLVPVSVLLITLAPAFVQNVLGPRWEGTVPIIQLLALTNIFGLFGDVVVPLLKGIGQPQKIILLAIVQYTLLLSLTWSLADHFGVVGVALSWLPAVGISQLISIVFVHQVFTRPFAGLGKSFLAVLLASGIGYGVALSTSHLLPGLVGFGAAVLLAGITVGFFLWELDRWLSIGLVHSLSQVFPQVADLVGIKLIKGGQISG